MIDPALGGPSVPRSLFDAVAFSGNAYCEAFSFPVTPRDHWQPLLAALDATGPSLHNQRRHPGRASRLAKRKGVGLDFAHLAISCLRAPGPSVRYVCGYLETKPPPRKPNLLGADAFQAWISLYVPNVGWLDLYPIPDENHIILAWNIDQVDVTPVKGGGHGRRRGHALGDGGCNSAGVSIVHQMPWDEAGEQPILRISGMPAYSFDRIKCAGYSVIFKRYPVNSIGYRYRRNSCVSIQRFFTRQSINDFV